MSSGARLGATWSEMRDSHFAARQKPVEIASVAKVTHMRATKNDGFHLTLV
ncbi:MAG TPA: hypothetical protein VH684_09375 [Xanthobacteraceae bacterium]|jgi:hypothetical protein